ncbi:MAG: OmpA family protein [Bacteroidota bacterium]
MKIFKLSILTLFVFVLSNVDGQYALKKKEAEHYFMKEGYAQAAETFKQAYGMAKTPEEKVAMIFKVGDSYRMMEEPEQAETWYRRALKINLSDNEGYYYLGKALQDQNRLDEAKEQFEKYKEKGGDGSKANAAIAECDRAVDMRKNATRYEVEPIPQLNTEFYDFGIAFANETNTKVLIGSSREGATGVSDYGRIDQSWMDLFESKQDKKGKWSEPVRVGSNVNTYGNEAASCLNSDKNRLYFTRCYNDEKSQNQKGCDIYVAPGAGGKWGTAKVVNLKPKDQPESSVGQPSLSKDGKLLFFASDMKVEGAKGGKDLYVSIYDEGSKSWSQPKNLASVNTSGDDMFPYIRNNGELYFSSNGHSGMGGLDIYKAAKTGDNEWGNIENMSYPINTAYNDFAIIFDGDEERGYLSSNRPEGKGYDDIYFFTLPAVEFKLEAYVVDKESGSMIEGADLEVVGSDGSSYALKSDANGLVMLDKNGEEAFIKKEVNYSLRASAPDYLVATDQITTVGLAESRTFINEFLLQPVIEGKDIPMREVRYDFGRWELQVNEEVNSKDSLDFLYNTLIENPTITIELQSHTDSRGGDAANMELSQKRAQSCVDYLISKGIPIERIIAKGMGETKLIFSDAEINALPTDAEREAAHQKNRRTNFTVLNWDYVPKK